MPVNVEFGRRLRDAWRDYEKRHDTKLTQPAVAERLGVTPQAVGVWFRTGQEPESFELVEQLAALLEVTPGWLAFGDSVPDIGAPPKSARWRGKRPTRGHAADEESA